MKRILLMLLAGCMLTTLGCAGHQVTQVKTDNKMSENKVQIAGKYVNPLTDTIYLDLKDDGTFNDRFGKRSISGKYVVNDNRVVLTYENGKIFEWTIEGNALIFKDGSRYIKK